MKKIITVVVIAILIIALGFSITGVICLSNTVNKLESIVYDNHNEIDKTSDDVDLLYDIVNVNNISKDNRISNLENICGVTNESKEFIADCQTNDSCEEESTSNSVCYIDDEYAREMENNSKENVYFETPEQ